MLLNLNRAAPTCKSDLSAGAGLAGIMVLVIAMVLMSNAARGSDTKPPLPPALGEDDFLPFDENRAALGRLLFYDPVLSGNRNISCGTCHHHDLASADALPLGVGEGGEGIGRKRTTGEGSERIDRRVPRNSPALFNLGHRDIQLLFHDGRLSISDLYGNGFNSPAEEYLPKGLNHIAAAQAAFPVTSETEMAGRPEENEIAGARNDRIDKVWALLTERIRAIDAYEPLFVDAYGEVTGSADIEFTHIANAIGDFVISEWRSFDSPFDRHLEGDPNALTPQAQAGLDVFFGKGQCAICHSGPLFTDQDFHALALPQFGPGRTRTFDLHARDVGRMGETDRIEDAYRFRTPSLRNAALTGPYGHNGAYADLEGIIRHHLDPQAAFDAWRPDDVKLPASETLEDVDFIILEDQRERQRVRGKVDIKPVALDEQEIQALIAFIQSLTGERSVKGRLGRPDAVPSGLPVD